MYFYKQIAVISLFLTIQILFFIPHYNNLFIILLKGVSSGGLIVLIASYAFPELIRSRKNKNNLNSKQKPFKDLQEYSFIDKRYLTLLENIKDGILSVNKNYVCGIYIFDQTSKTFNLKSSSEKIFKSDIELNNALLSSVFDKKTPKVFNHKDVKLEHWNELISNNKWRGSESAFCLPIKNNNDILGTLFVFIDHFSKINPSDIDIIQNFVEILNQGIVDIDISESQVLKNKNLNLIQDLFKEFEPGMESDIFFKSIKSACRSIFKYDKLTLSFKSSESENLSVVLTDGFDEDIDDGFSFNPRNSIIGLSFIDNKIVHSLDWKKQFPEMYRFDDAFDDSTYFPSVMSSPLRSDGKSIGSITLERMEQRLFSSTDIDLLKLLSENVSKVLGWMDIHHQLNRSASRDGLTGLLNHKTFLNRFAKEIDRSSRFGHHLGLIFFDIDKFKSVNDTYGHLYGDYVLEEVSRIINKNVRSIDIVGRYGGEEFSVLLVNTDINECKPLAEKIVKKIAKKTYLKDGIAVNLTISAGMSGFPLHSDSLERLIEKADKAMYVTKRNGGNGVSIAE
tara:strand:- start:2226 stop:3917 length:1692 start_codon:yes stop_codon:yes gene_type:complete